MASQPFNNLDDSMIASRFCHYIHRTDSHRNTHDVIMLMAKMRYTNTLMLQWRVLRLNLQTIILLRMEEGKSNETKWNLAKIAIRSAKMKKRGCEMEGRQYNIKKCATANWRWTNNFMGFVNGEREGERGAKGSPSVLICNSLMSLLC